MFICKTWRHLFFRRASYRGPIPSSIWPDLTTTGYGADLRGSGWRHGDQCYWPNTIVTGNLGVSPGSAITGFPPGVVTGAIQLGNAVSLQAKDDARTAYNNLTSQACTVNFLVPTDLSTLNLGPGVYCFASSASLTGTLTLTGTATDVWIFKTVSTLITGSGSSVVMSTDNGAAGQPCNVFWQVGSSATLGTTTSFIGNILAFTSITLNTDANVTGRALAGLDPGGGGAVTMDTNLITPRRVLRGGATHAHQGLQSQPHQCNGGPHTKSIDPYHYPEQL